MTITTTDTPEDEALRVLIDRQLIQQERCLPCVVDAVSANGTTVDVVVAISKSTTIEGQRLPIGDRTIRGVPIMMYGSTTLGLFVCAPIRPGDDGMLFAADRALDNWQHGDGVRMPPEMQTPRHSDFTDGFFYPGAQRASGGIENFPTTSITMQNRNGNVSVAVSDDAVLAKFGPNTVRLDGNGLSIVGPVDIEGVVTLTGDLGQRGNQVIDGVIRANSFITVP